MKGSSAIQAGVGTFRGFRAWGSKSRAWGFGFRGLGGLGFRVLGVKGFAIRVELGLSFIGEKSWVYRL